MSSKAVAWAWEQSIKPSSAKLLLMAMAEHANPYSGLAFPSVEALVHMTGQDRKTVLSGLQRLSAPELGLIIDTGKKAGKTQQITVWKLSMKGAENGTIKESRKRTGKSPVFPIEESRKRDTEPSKEPNRGKDSTQPEVDRDLFGDPVVSEEQRAAQLKAEVIQFVQDAWNQLSEEVPGVAALRGGTLDEGRGERAHALAVKFMVEGEEPRDVWETIFRKIRSSFWLCGETPPRDGRPPFKLQLTWLLEANQRGETRNFTKVLEGKYDDGRDPALSGGGARRRHSPAGQAALGVIERNRARRQRGAADRNSGVAYGG